jgi:adenosylcobinamide-GDP ribazoletransferase
MKSTTSDASVSVSWRFPPVIRGARAATIFLTRIPVGGFPYGSDDWRWAPAYFPLVGLGLGAIMALLSWCLQPVGPWVSAAVVVSIGMLLTGAFHEDGLADTADALGGAFNREKLFLILKDSRIGSFGAAALIMVLFLRVALLARLGFQAPIALLLTQSFARTPPVWLMTMLPYVTQDEEAKSRRVARARFPHACLASFWPLALGVYLVTTHRLPLRLALVLVLTAVATALLCGWRFFVRAGGLTGS